MEKTKLSVFEYIGRITAIVTLALWLATLVYYGKRFEEFADTQDRFEEK